MNSIRSYFVDKQNIVSKNEDGNNHASKVSKSPLVKKCSDSNKTKANKYNIEQVSSDDSVEVTYIDEKKNDLSKTKTKKYRRRKSESKKDDIENSDNNSKNKKCIENEVSSKNVFDIMMNARNKSIGSNSSGKEEVLDNESQLISKEIKLKRKQILEQWAEVKGKSVKEEQELAEEKYVKKKMKERAKRLKNMLMGQSNEHLKNVEPNSENSSQKINSKNSERKLRTKRLISSDEDIKESLVLVEKDVDDTFLSQLSSPMKKKDSLLGFFEKVKSTSPEDSTKKSDRVSLSECEFSLLFLSLLYT